ncbi:hypothetical protein HPB50_021850 [Hyalomma asiaticum]|uniref:Uncharacterized protein n=1 Tax=Hyalomma asiaticum TaxID=266040 RepID=A0ACB7TM36_HYAAI|nr:hypothetical protein HPB50_021850 [Hyalomma asiaticum]
MADSSDYDEVGNESAVMELTGSQSEMDLLNIKIYLTESELEIAREQHGSGQSSRVDRNQKGRSELRHF